jgi:hypothetical protein
MFAQLATVFVTVIGFYFGSSTAAAGVGTGITAAGASGKNSIPAGDGVPQALLEAKALAHDADLDLTRLENALNTLQQKSPPLDPTTLASAQKGDDDAKIAMGSIHTKVSDAIAAAAKFGTAVTDAENAASAAAVITARDAIKLLAAAVKAGADKVEALLKS